MAGLTVLQVRTEQRDRLRVSALASELAAADTALAAGTAVRTQLESQLGAAQREEADLRSRLGTASMAADIHALEQLIEANLLGQSPLRAQAAAAQDEVVRETMNRGRLAAHFARARTELAAAEASVLTATAANLETTAWTAALQGNALNDTVAVASGQPVSDEVAAARTSLGAKLGDVKFVDLLASRLADAQSWTAEPVAALDRVTAAADALTSVLSPSEGVLERRAAEHRRARAEVRAVVEGAIAKLAGARAQLQRAIASPGLTAAEVAYITARAVAPLDGKPSAVDKEWAVHGAAVTARQATGDFEAAALLAEATDATFDRDDPLVLVPERTRRDAAVAGLDTAQNAFATGDREKIDMWEVTIPPGAFALVVDTLRAVAAVDELKALKPTGAGGLNERLQSTEHDYATALRDRLLEQERDTEHRDRVQQFLEAAATQTSVASERLAAFVRGDA